MRSGWGKLSIDEFCIVTDYVANGSFASLRENVQYLDDDGYAVLVRLADSTKGWNGQYKYVSESAYLFLKKSSLAPGDLIMSNVGDPGKVFLVPDLGKPMTLGPNSILIRADNRVCGTRFLYYYFSSTVGRAEIENISEGVAQKKFNKTSFRKLTIALPPLPEQKRIVATLDDAFDRIDTAIANTEKNLANAREMFESYLNRLFREKGNGWAESTIGESCTIKSGTSVDNKLEKASGNVPYVKVADMSYQGNEISIKGSSRFLDNVNVRNIFPVGTTIFPKRGGAILTNKKRITDVEICADLNVMGVIPGGKIEPWFLYYYFIGVDMRKLGSGSSIPQINNYDIAPLPISYPVSRDDQVALVNKISSVSEMTHELEFNAANKLDRLNELKQSLLQKAFSGELTTDFNPDALEN